MKTLDDLPRKLPLGHRLEAAAVLGDKMEAMAAIEAGASPGARGRQGWRPLHLACGAVEEPQYGKVMGRSGSFRMPVDSPERAALVDWLIERSGGSDAKDGRGAAAAHWAAKWGMPLCLGSLSRSGADLNAKDNAGLVPLMWAAMRIDAYQEGGAIDVLVDSGAGVCEVDKAGSTALHHACRNPGALAALCKAGAPLEAKNRLGRTALHEACLANRAASVGALLAAGADPRACDAKGRFPHEFGGGKAARIAFAAYEAAEVSLSANVLASERRPAPRV